MCISFEFFKSFDFQMNGFPFNITFINQLLVFCVPPFSSALYFCIVTRVSETTQPEMCQKISKKYMKYN